MALRESNLSVFADQRYYHFVVAKVGAKFSLETYWKAMGDLVSPKNGIAVSEKSYAIEHMKLRSARAYARGAVSEALSTKGDGRPPFLYDLFAMKLRIKEESYALFGFPFVGLAGESIAGLIDGRKVVRLADLMAADVPKLVDIMETGIESPYQSLSMRIVGLQLVVTDDKSLAAVRLGGNDPLSAQVYVHFLKKRVSTGVVRPDHCVLACEREFTMDARGLVTKPRSLRSRLRFDAHGNFRFYAHVGCGNLQLLPYAIGQLADLGCLKPAAGNPLLRAGRDDDE